MQNPENAAQILDFNSFRQQAANPPAPVEGVNVNFKPVLVWYPMWVMVPDQPSTPPAS